MNRVTQKMQSKTSVVFIALILFLANAISACRIPYGDYECICCQGLHNNLRIAPVLGGRISVQPRFVWLPTKNQILYQSQAGKIFAVVVDDKNSFISRQIPGLEGYQLDVSSDGSRIALSTRDGLVNIYDLPGALLSLSISNAYKPIWSPDDRLLAIGSTQETHSQVELLELDTPDERTIIVGSKGQSYYLKSWSNQGDYIALNSADPDPLLPYGVSEKIYTLQLSTGEIRPLVTLAGCQRMPAWSPDDSLVAFVANPGENWDLFVTELGQDKPQNVSNTPDSDEYQPSWSPDGRYIVYVAFTPTSKTTFEQDIYLVDMNSYEVRRLTNTPDEHESLPLWSPNGDKIAYLSVIDDTWYLNLINPDGSGQERLATIGSE